jgi:UTP:GlnB (protein PII) uridylyltransferase
MDEQLKALLESGITAYESSFTALDAYFGVKNAPLRFLSASCALQDLAKAFDELEYPGTHYADVSIEKSAGADTDSGKSLRLRCIDSPSQAESASFAQLDLLRDPSRDVFLDPKGVYSTLRSPTASLRSAAPEAQLFESAILVSRYPYKLEGGSLPPLPRDFPIESQRDMLALMLTGSNPERGLELLRLAGFVETYWPELAGLSGTDQSKEFHPEGDAWAHTLETFRYRKLPELRLSLALLMHDAGKPRAESADGRKFDRHAEIGSSVAERFLRRLGFEKRMIEDVAFLVRFHMMPAALPRLPANRLEGVIDDPRFPLLLELYKCDELSTFRGPDGYYEACAAYKAWRKNSRNPWRDAEGKKLMRLYVESEKRPVASRRQ